MIDAARRGAAPEAALVALVEVWQDFLLVVGDSVPLSAPASIEARLAGSLRPEARQQVSAAAEGAAGEQVEAIGVG